MVVDKLLLLKFIDLIKLKSGIEVSEALLNINKSEINVTGKFDNTFAFKGKLLGNFEDIGEIGIDDLNFFKNSIKSFNSPLINIDKKDNKLNITSKDSKLKVSMILRSPQYITTKLLETDYNKVFDKAKGNEFVLTSEQVKKLYNYVNSLNPSEIILEGKEDNFTFRLMSNENKIIDTFKIDNKINEFSAIINKVTIDIFNFLNSDINISIKNESPILFKVKNDNYEFEYIIATLR